MADKTDSYRRRELYKLIVARDSMNSVMDAVELAIGLKVESDHPLYKILHDNIVTSYGRPFTEMKPFGTLPSKWSKFDDEELREAHAVLMYHRHKSVGHTEYIQGKVMMYPKGAKRSDGQVTQRVQYEVLTQSFAPNAFIPIQKLVGNLVGRLDLTISNQMKALYGEDGSKITATSELITEDDLKGLV